MLNVSSTDSNNERLLFMKLSYTTIDNVSTNLLPAGLQDFQVLNVSKVTSLVNKLLECSPDRIVRTDLRNRLFPIALQVISDISFSICLLYTSDAADE